MSRRQFRASNAQILRILGAAAVMRALREDCDAVAELGTSWSANLFTL
jgi:hypothetical protein